MAGPAALNRAASASYKKLDESTKERLVQVSAASGTEVKQMTANGVRKAASKSCTKIKREVRIMLLIYHLVNRIIIMYIAV